MSLPPGFTCAQPPSRVTWQCRECFQCIDADRDDDPHDFGWRNGRCPECSDDDEETDQ